MCDLIVVRVRRPAIRTSLDRTENDRRYRTSIIKGSIDRIGRPCIADSAQPWVWPLLGTPAQLPSPKTCSLQQNPIYRAYKLFAS